MIRWQTAIFISARLGMTRRMAPRDIEVPDEDAGVAYGQLIMDQLAEERNRKASLEARGVTVITTSGTLATLLFALTAGLTAAAKFKLPQSAKLPLLLALVAFVIAALAGLASERYPCGTGKQPREGLARLVGCKILEGAARSGTTSRSCSAGYCTNCCHTIRQ